MMIRTYAKLETQNSKLETQNSKGYFAQRIRSSNWASRAAAFAKRCASLSILHSTTSSDTA